MRPEYIKETDRIINELLEAQDDLANHIDDLWSLYAELDYSADEEETYPELDELSYEIDQLEKSLDNLQESIRKLTKARGK